jgi:hypothetical protein
MDELPFIETPINPNRVGRTFIKMSNQPTQEAPKVKAKYAKTKGEHFKDIVIAVLVSGVIAFIGGMTFQGKQQDAINTAVKGAQVVAQPEVKK